MHQFYRLEAYILKPGLPINQVTFPPDRSQVRTRLNTSVSGRNEEIFIDHGVVMTSTKAPVAMLNTLRESGAEFIALVTGESMGTAAMYACFMGVMHKSACIVPAWKLEAKNEPVAMG